MNAFTISPKKWIELTNAIGLRVKSGRSDGGTYAHKDIAFEFASWISAEFKVLLNEDIRIKRFWNFNRLEFDAFKPTDFGWFETHHLKESCAENIF